MEIIHRAKPAKMIYSHKRQNGFNIFSCIKNSQTQTHSTQIVLYIYPYGTSSLQATVSWKRSLPSFKATPLLLCPICFTVLFLKGQCPSTEGDNLTCCNSQSTREAAESLFLPQEMGDNQGFQGSPRRRDEHPPRDMSQADLEMWLLL